jgi:hypothetical protein
MTLADVRNMRDAVRRHGSPTLRRWGVYVMIFGGSFFLLPIVLRKDVFLDVHETFSLASRVLWCQFAGVAALVCGNTMRLIGAQGHPGLPFFGKRAAHELMARVQLRRRAWENRMAALAGNLAPPTLQRAPWNWSVRRAARQASRRRGMPLPTCLRRAAYAAAN